MRTKILIPSTLYSRLKSKDEDFLPSHFQSELITRKCLPESHLRIPEKVWNLSWILYSIALEILSSLIYCRYLLWTHAECQCSILFIFYSVSDGIYSSLYVTQLTAEPLPMRIGISLTA